MKKDNLILNKHILAIQKRMQNNNAGCHSENFKVTFPIYPYSTNQNL